MQPPSASSLWPVTKAIVPFINQIDLKDGLQKGREVARGILAKNHPQVPYVILGQAQCTDPVVEMLDSETGDRVTDSDLQQQGGKIT